MRELCEIDPQQLSQVTGGGLLARWLARRPLLRALLQELLGGGKGEGGEGSPGGEAAQGAAAAASGGAGGAPKRGAGAAGAGAAG